MSSRDQIGNLMSENQVLRCELQRMKEVYHSKCEELRRREEVSLSFQASESECLAGVMELKYQEEIAVLQGVRTAYNSVQILASLSNVFCLCRKLLTSNSEWLMYRKAYR